MASKPEMSGKSRERGNALYKKGDLIQAEASYIEAARLDPTDVLTFSNICAVKFEMGNYAGCLLFGQRALKLLDSQAPIDAEQMRQKLYRRLAKAHFCSLKLEEAEEILAKITSEDVRLEHQASVSQTMRLRHLPLDDKTRWHQVLDRLPRYRPALLDVPEYFSVGHDDADSVVDSGLLASNSDETIACLFCGIGDARNLLVTLTHISISQLSMPGLSTKRFHFTLVDIHPAVFARDLLIFRLLLDSAGEPKTRQRETIVTLSYVYSAHVMPRWAYDRLQVGLSSVCEDLAKEDVMGIFYIPHDARAKISRYVEFWQKPLSAQYGTAKLRELVRAETLESRTKNAAMLQGSEVSSPPGCDYNSPDALGYVQFTAMLPHIDLLKKYEPVLLNHFTAYTKRRSPTTARAVNEYLDAKWEPNVTLVDSDFENKRENKHSTQMDSEPYKVVCDLFANIPAAVAGNTTGILNHLCGFFEFISTWTQKIQQQLTVEIVLGEMVDTFERLSHGILRQKHERMGRLNPAVFPNSYDRVHMSNIPDYIGGPLTTFLSGVPILRHQGSSWMQSNVLRNTSLWITHDQFLAEHLLLADRRRIHDHFKVSLSDVSAKLEKDNDGKIIGGVTGVVMIAPFAWTYRGSGPLPWEKMMPRVELERWLVAHFLKLVLPFPREVWSDKLVFAPLNMTTFFRLVAHIAELGYPTHWISNLLSALCEGEITTTARAPRAVVMEPNLVKVAYPPRKMCLGPFMVEFKVLLSVWRALLPFGVLLQHEILPDLKAVREYRISFPPRDLRPVTWQANPHYALVLGHRDILKEKDLRQVLLDDEVGDRSSSAAKSRAEPSIHVISTFKWKMETMTATFWFDEALIDDMRRNKGWVAYIWRTDTWLPELGPATLDGEDALTVGQTWC